MYQVGAKMLGGSRIKGIPQSLQNDLSQKSISTNPNILSISNITNSTNLNNSTNLTTLPNTEFINIQHLPFQTNDNLTISIPKKLEPFFTYSSKTLEPLSETTPRTPAFSPYQTSESIETSNICDTPISISENQRQTSAPAESLFIKVPEQETKKNIIKFANSNNFNSPLSLTRTYTDTGKIKKMKTKNTIIYPIFEKCSLLTTDEFWIDLFNKASIGKFKRGFSFKDNYLIFNKNKDKIYLDVDPVRALNECLYFFKTKAGIQSETDKMMERKIIESKIVDIQRNIQYTWGDFKKSKTKELFINEYINKVASIHLLNTFEKAQLKYIINYGLIVGCFGNHNIVFKDTKIQNIDGLLFDPLTRIFSISPSYPPKKPSNSKSSKKSNVVPLFTGKYVSITEKWNKFLQHFENKPNSKHNYNEKFEKSGSNIYSKVGYSNDS
jgi:hypothetical protein